ncbi:MAG: cytochrome C biogenesis protein [Verrucomicrobia bacterium Tous-C9LFEB]|nr:MAG: cytochrome C biogenesis protein [Verrucomicrobia bacterium Tous-C9LFEB]
METLFTTLTHAIEGSVWLAVMGAVLWGILSILLSPCHLSSIPLIVGFMSGQGRISTARAFVISSLFAFGILLTIALLGVITAMAGRMMGDVGAMGNYLVAVVFFTVGLHLFGVISIPWFSPGEMGMQRKGLVAAFILGLIFGIAVGPCTFAYMAPMLGVTFKLGASQPLYAASLLLTYGVGHCGVIVLAGTSMGWVERYLKWDAQSKTTVYFRVVCGVSVILAGLYLIYTAK